MKTVLFCLCACLLWVSVGLAQPTPVIATPIADVSVTTTATLVRAYTPTRTALSCTNHGTDAVRWGPSTITVTSGQRIPSGSSIEIEYIGEVYMIAEAGTATVSCTEERK